MPAEDPAVGMQLVDHDDAELLEQLEPLRVVGEDRAVEHVGVRDHDLAGCPDGRPDRRRRVAVVGRGDDRQPGRRGELAELRDLVLAEGLGREEHQGPRRRVVHDRLEDREHVAQALARRRRGDDDRVLAGMDRVEGIRLVDVRPLDAARRQPVHDARVQPVRELAEGGLSGGDHRVMDDASGDGWLGQEVGQDGRGVRGGVQAHGRSSMAR